MTYFKVVIWKSPGGTMESHRNFHDLNSKWARAEYKSEALSLDGVRMV
jgi:hypothetical protein